MWISFWPPFCCQLGSHPKFFFIRNRSYGLCLMSCPPISQICSWPDLVIFKGDPNYRKLTGDIWTFPISISKLGFPLATG
ncbi:hypothetical protein ASPVEDRAFT_47638 [Aspergillus versicolor CBS 583.65]|uniref:Sugar phosphate phosphatase n=1 Tax=Aspergillus versicolor CBS 583.65 TaxID=1036611 RepID=A0A1L9Q3X6_ASPVE|nr:uncharacterized protein ASPVEDRAFT_47638 [Aspergillus versicolor CBS 583.65]OJJ08483.1 hypothetical protein ASPVEDRAFT_47638 [Aspergillus versicolor CBS 583.65]